METLVECFKRVPKSEAPELEIRLGTLTTDERFCAGVGKQFFEQLEQDLLECTTLVADPGGSKWSTTTTPRATGKR